MRKNPEAAFLFSSHAEVIRNNDVTYPFRQDSSFYYLTGFEEPDSFLILLPAQVRGGDARLILFVRNKDPEKEMWDGARYGVDGAAAIFGADEAYPIEELEQKLPEYLKGVERVYYRIGHHEATDRKVMRALEVARKASGRSGKGLLPIQDPTQPLGEMRLFKSPEEIEILRKVTEISADAHAQIMKEVRPGMMEYEVAAFLDYHLRRHGCQRLGYESIIAGGKNAACLHYRVHREVLKEGDLLLIDAGGELDYYSADITRTFPIGKKFNEIQAKVYNLVLQSQVEAIKMVKPGIKLPEIHKKVCEILVEGFLSLGLMMGNRNEIIQQGSYKRFYPHNTSHWLGMDVHDAGLYTLHGESRPLEPGMVFTIEPGFYVQPQDAGTPPVFRNIGIRIEDDILVTETGCEVLTAAVPKTIEEIEKLRSN